MPSVKYTHSLLSCGKNPPQLSDRISSSINSPKSFHPRSSNNIVFLWPQCINRSRRLRIQSGPEMTNCVLILSMSIDVQLLWHISLRLWCLSVFGRQCDKANWWFPLVCGMETWFTFTWRKEKKEIRQMREGTEIRQRRLGRLNVFKDFDSDSDRLYFPTRGGLVWSNAPNN